MHELALMESVIAAVGERVQDARVAVVRLEIGLLAAVVPEALRFCFDLCARGTSCEGAALDIVAIEGRGRCRACGAEVAIESYLAQCPCGGLEVDVIAGNELRVKEVEVEAQVPPQGPAQEAG